MQRLDLQFYAFFMVVLSGMALGLLFDLLRGVRGYFRPNRWVAAVGDLLFWGAATPLVAGGLFFGNWGQFRFYVLVAMLLGIGLYYWLASPLVLSIVRLLLRALTWLLHLLGILVLRLIWGPLVALAELVIGAGRIIWRWICALGQGAWSALCVLGGWLVSPLIRPYRCIRLRYLLAKRRAKRALRRWLLGSGRPSRK